MKSEIVRLMRWFFSGVAFTLGAVLILHFSNKLEESEREFAKSELVGLLDLVDITSTVSEDRLAFNGLVKNRSKFYFSYAWLRVELYDSNSAFITSCDSTTGDFEPGHERWVQIKCSTPGFAFQPEYSKIEYGIMTAKGTNAGT